MREPRTPPANSAGPPSSMTSPTFQSCMQLEKSTENGTKLMVRPSLTNIKPPNREPRDVPTNVTCSVDEFRAVQKESTDKIAQHLVQLQAAQIECNELHREELALLRQALLPGVPVPTISVTGPPNKAVTGPPVKSALAENGLGVKKVNKADDVARAAIALMTSASPMKEAKDGSPKVVVVGTNPNKDDDMMNNRPSTKTAQTDITKSSVALTAHVRTPRMQALKVQHGSVLTWGVGYSGKRKLLGYNFNHLQAYAAIPAIFARCSIFMLRKALLVQIAFQPVLIAACMMVSKIVFGDDDLDFADSSLAKSLNTLTDSMTRLVPFLLGLFIAIMLRRWWALRSTYLQRIFVSTTNLSFFVGLMLPPETEELRLRVERYLLCSHKLIYLCARQQTSEKDYKKIVEEGLLTEDELAHLNDKIGKLPQMVRDQIGNCDAAIAGIPVTWAAQIIHRMFVFAQTPCAKELGFAFPVPLMIKMITYCADIRRGIQDVEMTLNTPLPFPYVHIVTLLVHCSAIFACIRSGVFLGAVNGKISYQNFLADTIVVCSLNALYSGLLCLTVVLTNPFTDECIDFPAANFQCRLWKSQVYARDAFFNTVSVDKAVYKEMGVTANDISNAKKKAKEDDDEDEEEDDEDDDDGGDCGD